MARQLALRILPYGGAAVAVATAFGVRMLLHPVLGDNRPFLTFLAAVALAGWLGGRGAAMFAIILSYTLANWFLIPPLDRFNFDPTNVTDWVNFVIFVGLALVIVEPILALQRAKRRAEADATEISRLLAEAKDTAQRKDRFLATLSHELRNPLATLSRALEFLSLRPQDAAEMENLRPLMTRQVRQISRLVDDLLDVARTARGALRLKPERTDLVSLLAHAIESIRAVAAEREHQLHVDLPAEEIVIKGDVVRLTQVFLNILDNAIKYTSRKGAIWVSACREGDAVVVRIRDNGPGISLSTLPTVFEMFSQATSTLEHSAGGLGIGLYLVQQMVTLHGGTVEANSDGLGTGSEFVVRLPACPVVNMEAPDESNGRANRLSTALRSHKIVVADDVQESAATLAEMLRTLGQEVAVANDGAAAVRSVIAEHPQIVFLDIGMPGMDGYEVAARLRAGPDAASLVLVALTGFGGEEDRQRAFDAGFNHHLTKPTNLEELEDLLVEI